MKCKDTRVFNGVSCNCGTCTACRVNYTLSWKLRLLYELCDWDDATFLTLNYSDDWFEHLKSIGCEQNVNNLNAHEVTSYFKRLRRRISYSRGGRLKYYCSGEYGDARGRAHYHAIIFGVSCYSDDDLREMRLAWNEPSLSVGRNEEFQWLRSRGPKCAVQPVTPDDIAYVTGYVQKKLRGKMAKEKYGDRTAPFARMSNGLGLSMAKKQRDVLKKGYTYLPGGVRVGVPRYFREKLDIEFKPVLDSSCFEDEFWNFITAEFDKQFPLTGSSEAALSLHSRQFEWFVNDYCGKVADSCWKDFEQRSKLKAGVF